MRILSILILLSLCLLPVSVQAQDYSATLSWTAPIDGSDVEFYECQLSADGGEWLPYGAPVISLSIDVILASNVIYLLRVRGVNHNTTSGELQYGIWSPVSDPFVYDPPGQVPSCSIRFGN